MWKRMIFFWYLFCCFTIRMITIFAFANEWWVFFIMTNICATKYYKEQSLMEMKMNVKKENIKSTKTQAKKINIKISFISRKSTKLKVFILVFLNSI